MQPTVEPVRGHLTAAQVAWLIEGAPSVAYGAGLEVTNRAQTFVEDVTDDLRAGGSVERSALATLHGRCHLNLSRWLDWGAAVLMPYMTITDGAITARFNLGAYLASTPAQHAEEDPPTYEVDGYDLIHGLNTPVGDAYSIGAGEAYLPRVADILTARGFTRVIVDQSAAATVTPTTRAWAPDPNITWLTIINDMLAAVGYMGIWSDWNGYLRCEPYEPPRQRRVEWVFDTGPRSILAGGRRIEYDYFDAPNRWVIFQSNVIEGQTPVEDNGIYIFQNDSVGPTSVQERDGLVRTRHEGVDVAGHAELVARAQQMIDADMSVPMTIPRVTAPFPLAWHFDRFYHDDPALGRPVDVLGTQWSLPLDGSAMQHSWQVLS